MALASVVNIRTLPPREAIRLDLGPPQPSLAWITGVVCTKAGLRHWEIRADKSTIRLEAARGTIAWLAACFGHSPDDIGDYLGRDPGEAAAIVAMRERVIQKSPDIADMMIGLFGLIEAACP